MFKPHIDKIKEETGGDVTKIVSLLVTPAKGLTKGRHSRTGSSTSLSSFTIDGTKDEGAGLDLKLADGRTITPKEFKKLETKEDEWRKKLQKKDEDFATQVKKQEEIWKKKLDDAEKDHKKSIDKKNAEINVLHANLSKLENDAKLAEEYKLKICRYQEELDQLEGFQSQEMAKIKHLLLQKEQTLLENEETVKKLHQKILDQNLEIRRLLDSERKLSDIEDRLEELRHASEQEKAGLVSRLAAEEESSRQLKDRIAVLDERCRGYQNLSGEMPLDDRLQGLLGERTLLERLLAEAHEHLAEVKTTWSGKITSLETQLGRLCRQASEESAERREAEKQRDLLLNQVRVLEANEIEFEQRIGSILKEKNDLIVEMKNLEMKIMDNRLIPDNQDDILSQNQSKLITNLEEKIKELTKMLENEKMSANDLMTELKELRAAYEDDKGLEEQLREDVARERTEKDELLLRNAQVSQEVELMRRELRNVQQEANDLSTKVGNLEENVKKCNETIGKERIEKGILTRRLEEFENQEKDLTINNEKNDQLANELAEKNRMVKSLQQRINDMKKAMQRELKVPSRSIDPGGANGDGFNLPHGPALLTASSSSDDHPDDVNFKYLKHVVFKFLTCREHEAQHLTRAVSTLLRLTTEEERLLRETIDWRMSWFGSRPKIGPKNLRS